MKNFFLLIFVFLISFSLQAQTWSAVGNGVNGQVNCFAIYNNELYVGGQFELPGSTEPIGLFKWNGSTFDTLPGTYLFGSSAVSSLAVYNNELYVAGVFCKGCAQIPSVFDRIARWNGSSWDSVGNGFDQSVQSLAVYHGNLYAGGSFNFPQYNPDTIYGGRIARWNGSQWSQVSGTGIDAFGEVDQLLVYSDELYVEGNYLSINGNSNLKIISRWSDSTWNEVGPGGANGLLTMAVFNGELYAIGLFDSVGGIAANHFAKWNGSTWAPIGINLSPWYSFAASLQEYNNELYAGGSFSTANGIACNSIARFNGISWDSVGSGTDSTGIIIDTLILDPWDTLFSYAPHSVLSFCEFNNDLYVGGSFNMIGGVVAHNIAKWSMPVGIDEISSNQNILLYPNPTNKNVSLNFSSLIESLTLYGTDGKLFRQFNHLHQSKFDLDVSDLSNGMYFVIASSGNKIYRGKILVAH